MKTFVLSHRNINANGNLDFCTDQRDPSGSLFFATADCGDDLRNTNELKARVVTAEEASDDFPELETISNEQIADEIDANVSGGAKNLLFCIHGYGIDTRKTRLAILADLIKTYAESTILEPLFARTYSFASEAPSDAITNPDSATVKGRIKGTKRTELIDYDIVSICDVADPGTKHSVFVDRYDEVLRLAKLGYNLTRDRMGRDGIGGSSDACEEIDVTEYLNDDYPPDDTNPEGVPMVPVTYAKKRHSYWHNNSNVVSRIKKDIEATDS